MYLRGQFDILQIPNHNDETPGWIVRSRVRGLPQTLFFTCHLVQTLLCLFFSFSEFFLCNTSVSASHVARLAWLVVICTIAPAMRLLCSETWALPKFTEIEVKDLEYVISTHKWTVKRLPSQRCNPEMRYEIKSSSLAEPILINSSMKIDQRWDPKGAL